VSGLPGPQPRFEAVPGGYRFSVRYEPAESPTAARGTIVFAHAFAEEMNRSRRTVALAARALAGLGWRVVLPDLHGCGDSSGEFGDARWSDWIDDLARAARSAAPSAQAPLWLWGLRAGALLLPAVLEALTPAAPHLLLWQPAASGQQALTQFLRLGAAAGIVGSGAGTDVATLRTELGAGRSVEVAGYTLDPGLALGLDAARLEPPAGFHGRVVWLESGGAPDAGLSMPARQRVDAWSARGIAVQAESVEGPPFWQTQEISEGTALVARTVELIGGPGKPGEAGAP
jgi:exosortase A-associated hydrolase 2